MFHACSTGRKPIEKLDTVINDAIFKDLTVFVALARSEIKMIYSDLFYKYICTEYYSITKCSNLVENRW